MVVGVFVEVECLGYVFIENKIFEIFEILQVIVIYYLYSGFFN